MPQKNVSKVSSGGQKMKSRAKHPLLAFRKIRSDLFGEAGGEVTGRRGQQEAGGVLSHKEEGE